MEAMRGLGQSRSMASMLTELSGRVNPRPVQWWGLVEDPSYDLLRQVFAGRSHITKSNTLRHVCCNHALVIENPGTFARAIDTTSKVTAVHGCAMNGYVETLRVLVEKGGADIFAICADGIDALRIAQTRNHVDVVSYILECQAEECRRRLALPGKEEALAELTQRQARSRELKTSLAKQARLEEEKRKLLYEEKKRIKERAAQERAWRELGMVPVRRGRWRSIDVDIDDRKPPLKIRVGYYPRILH